MTPALRNSLSNLVSLLMNSFAADTTEGRDARSHFMNVIGGHSVGSAKVLFISSIAARALEGVRAER